MTPEPANLLLRPRAPWEAIDLGTRLAGRHRRHLTLTWLCASLAPFLLLSVMCWQHPGVVLFMLWWSKPLLECLMLHSLAQAVFSTPPTLGQALRAWPSVLKQQWLPGLTLWRLSPTRSLDLPVRQLEGLAGSARAQRLHLIRRGQGRCASWLTLAGTLVESSLVLGALAGLLMLLPAPANGQWFDHLSELLNLPGIAQPGLGHLSNALYLLALAFWGPLYVASGFTLYLNRRTHLEAWDIEQVLRALRQRLLPVLASVAILCASLTPAPSVAEERLGQQALSAPAAHQAISALVAQPPFSRVEQRSEWQLKHPPALAPKAPAGSAPAGLAEALRIALWLTLASVVAWLAWHYRRPLGQRLRPTARTAPPTAPGLQPPPLALPAQLADHAEQLWPHDPRQALALLYQGLLARLASDYKLPVTEAATEADVLARVSTLKLPGLEDFSRTLSHHWLNAAYGHQLPPADACRTLCDGWRHLFGSAEVAP